MTNDTQLRAATRAIGWAFTFAMLAVATACTDSSGPSAPQPNGLTALVTSPPVPGTLSANAAVSGTLGYVSLRPGGVPDGLSATIRIGAQGVPTEAAVVEGGFDPVGLAASAGDTAFVVITRANGAPPVSGYQVISAVRRPTIIRTSPPEGKRDVPLNAIIVIVFSEPVDPATLDSATIQLTRDAAQVAGRVRPNGTGGFRAEFDPDSLLAPNTDYRLTVLNGIKDLSGAPVDSVPLDVTFTSGTAAVARAVSGTVSGLTGSGLVLHLNAIEDLPVGSNGSFTFASRLAEGDAVTVTVSALPSAPNQLCSVSGGDGIISGQDFSGVTVACFVADPQGQVLFSSSGGDPVTHIYMLDLDHSTLTRLTTGSDADSAPEWSPDHSLVAFQRRAAGSASGVWVMGADGRSQRQVSSREGAPTWAPDGERLAVVSLGKMYIVNIRTRSETEVADSLDSLTSYDFPRWSPDGSTIAINGHHPGPSGDPISQLYLIDTTGANLRRLTNDYSYTNDAEETTEWDASWSPDGTRIAYWSFLRGITVLASNGTGDQAYSVTGDYNFAPAEFFDSSPDWSSDGYFIVFRKNGQLVIAPANQRGGVQRIVTAIPGGAFTPAWRR